MERTIFIWLLVMSCWAFILMGVDKYQSTKKRRRVSEKSLWTIAIVGGAWGAYLGMQLFRHKRRKTSFRLGFLILSLLYLAGILYLFNISLPIFTKL